MVHLIAYKIVAFHKYFDTLEEKNASDYFKLGLTKENLSCVVTNFMYPKVDIYLVPPRN